MKKTKIYIVASVLILAVFAVSAASLLGTPEAAPDDRPSIADTNGDLKVDIVDLSFLLRHWLQDEPSADFNNDRVVNIFDLGYLLSQWGREDTASGGTTSIVVRAKGTTGTERIELRVKGVQVAQWTVSQGYTNYSATYSGAVSGKDVRVEFLNNGEFNGVDMNVEVDHTVINGVTYQSEGASVYSTGTYTAATGCAPGFKRSQILHCNGYFEYNLGGDSSGGGSSDWPDPAQKSTINIATFGDSNTVSGYWRRAYQQQLRNNGCQYDMIGQVSAQWGTSGFEGYDMHTDASSGAVIATYRNPSNAIFDKASTTISQNQADVAYVIGGTNDIKDLNMSNSQHVSTLDDIVAAARASLLDAATRSPNTYFYVVSVLDIRGNSATVDSYNTRMSNMVAGIASQAKVRFLSAPTSDSDIGGDGIHFTVAGAERYAQNIFDGSIGHITKYGVCDTGGGNNGGGNSDCESKKVVTVTPSSSLASLVNSSGNEQACFRLSNGTYSFGNIRPKSGQMFVGESRDGVRVNGSGYENAFHGTASNVTIRNFTLFNYNNLAGQSAQEQSPIRGTSGIWQSQQGSMASDWLIEDMRIYDNAAAGIFMGNDFIVRNNILYNNGITGIGGDEMIGGLIEGNDIYNNGANEASGAAVNGGGIKITQYDGRSKQLVIRDNDVHDNKRGIWCDVDCNGVLIEGNNVYDNQNTGIFYEVSRNATIRNNSVTNSSSYANWLSPWNSGSIAIGESESVVIEGNTISGGVSALTIRGTFRPASGESYLQNRINSGKYLSTTARNITVRNNTINGSASIGASHESSAGSKMDYGSIRFSGNSYSNPGGMTFWWNRQSMNYSTWQSAGRQ